VPRRAANGGSRSKIRKRGGYHSPSPEAREAERASLAVAEDLAPLLDALGIDYRRGDGGRKLTSPCPSPDHSDRSPSWFLNNDPNDPRFGTHACSSCEFRGGIAHLATRANRGAGDWTEGAALLRSLFGDDIDVDRVLDRVARRRARRSRSVFEGIDLDALGLVPSPGTPGGDYLAARGIPEWAQVVIGARWAAPGTTYPRDDDDDLRLDDRVILPVFAGGACETFAARTVDRRNPLRYLYPPSPMERAIWGLDLWNPSGKTVAVCEGILDGWALRVVTGLHAYAVLRSHMTHKQAARLRTAEAVYVVGDADDAGDKLRADVAARLPSVRDLFAVDLPRGYDPADALSGKLDPDVVKNAIDEATDLRAAKGYELSVQYGKARRRS